MKIAVIGTGNMRAAPARAIVRSPHPGSAFQPRVSSPHSRNSSGATNRNPVIWKSILIAAMSILTGSAALAGNAASNGGPTVCWLEISHSNAPGAMGGEGIRDTRIWHSTVSSILVRDTKGDVLIDTGFSQNAASQMQELPAAARAFGLQILAANKNRISIIDALRSVGEAPSKLARIIVTHGHYDHLGGASELTAPIYVAPAEREWLAEQAIHPTITPPSLVAAVWPRLRSLPYDSGPYFGFKTSDDIYGDGAIVVVPLPGHTPGSQGVFIRLHRRRIFLLGDATDTLEAAVRGLPKNPVIRAATDWDPKIADMTARRIAAFHRAHPDIALIPAHDRDAYAAVFGQPDRCIAAFPRAVAK
jgi:N-acyl homoserine lactone hydrolase